MRRQREEAADSQMLLLQLQARLTTPTDHMSFQTLAAALRWMKMMMTMKQDEQQLGHLPGSLQPGPLARGQ